MEVFLTILLVAAIIGLIWLYIQLRKAKQQQAEMDRRLQERERENLLLESEHLKFQLQPHTLNNILANLKTIATKLSRGMDSLSNTLEYILYKGRTNLVSVEEEIHFVETYLKLNDLFLSEVDAIVIDTDGVDRASPHFKNSCIPHLISAYFIENAFKHGDKDHPEFLRIRVQLDRKLFQLHVTNRVKQRPDERIGGLGLTNMEKRLELLMAGQYEVRTSSTQEEYHAILTIRCEP